MTSKSELISQRTKSALAAKVGTGQLGNKRNLAEAQAKGQATNQAASAEFSRKMMGLLGNLRDDMSMNQVAAHLNQMGVPTMRGGTWTAKAVSRVKERAALFSS